MADVRCPMCGKPNPAELEICQFCQARLKPLRVNPSQEEPFSSSDLPVGRNDSPDDVPDWLHSLRQPDEEDAFLDEGGMEDELPDWLSQPLDSGGDDLVEEPSEEPDWLSGLRDRSAMTDEGPGAEEDQTDIDWTTEESAVENEALPDWLAGMRSDGDSAVQDEVEPVEPVSPAQDEPDWLLKIRSHTDQPEEEPPIDPQPPVSESEGQDLFGFADFEQEELTEKEVAPSQTPAFDDLDFSDIPDWLSVEASDQPDEEDSGSQEGSTVGWPSGAQAAISSDEDILQELDTPESAPPPQAEAERAEEIPDWLAELSPDTDQASRDDDSSGWLDFEAEEPRSEADDGSAIQPFHDESLEMPAEAALEESSAPFEQDLSAEELPDWLAEIGKQPAEGEEAELPDWLAESGGENKPPGSSEESTHPAVDQAETSLDFDWDLAAEAQTSTEKFDVSFEDENLDWLKDTGTSLSGEDAVDTADDIKPVAPFELEGDLEGSAEPIATGDVPDWLAEAGPKKGIFGEEDFEEPEFAQENPEEESQPDLAQANLPSWVEAMRPVEASAADLPKVEENSNLIESIGPLAGLRGVLPAEPDISQVKKPPAYLIKLQVTDAQKANAALLEQMIKTESQPRAIPKRPAISSQHILRIIIAIVLIVAVVWPLVMGGPQLPQPAFSPEAAATSQLITALNPDAPVLLAVDFEPGWSGEMDAVAAPVIDHLMLKGAFLALVSTTPSGPPQAEYLMNFVRQHEEAQLQSGLRYANLGFIPGGPAGLLSFAETPQQVLPVSQEGTHVWQSGPLANVKSLADFGMVVVITENPQTARAWIEQVRPSMGNAPLVMVTSAQAEPLVRPFYDAIPQQVQGMVTGLAGGLAYEDLTGRSGAAGAYWNAFGVGLAVAGALIIVGGIFNAAIALFARRKEDVEGDE